MLPCSQTHRLPRYSLPTSVLEFCWGECRTPTLATEMLQRGGAGLGPGACTGAFFQVSRRLQGTELLVADCNAVCFPFLPVGSRTQK